MGTNSFEDYVITEENKEETLNHLRSEEFIAHISSKELEMIINQLDFKSLFNIIQNKVILDKINILQTNILEKDSVFFPNFLDSPILINKTSHSMIYDMLNYLSNTTVLYYLVCPYIREKLTNDEVINLLYNKETPFSEVEENDYLFNSIPSNLLANYINKLWLKEQNSKTLTKKVIKKLFHIRDEVLEKINLDEVDYLFETIKTKNILSIQETKITLSSYKALLSSYLVFGTKKTLDIINNGNTGIDVDTINTLLNDLVERDLTELNSHTFNTLHNIEKNILNNLRGISAKRKSDFAKKVTKNTYLNSIISSMISNEYISYDDAIEFLYNVNSQKDDVVKQRMLSSFCNGFVNHIINKKKKELENNIKNTVLKHFELKKNIREKEYRKLCTLSLQRIKLKLFIEALKGNIRAYAFKNENPTIFLNNYRKFIKETGLEESYFIDNILIPLSNDCFEISSFLENIGIHKPYNYNLYIDMQKDKEIIFEINSFLKEIKNKYKPDITMQIINYICYGTKIKAKVHKKDFERIREFYKKTYEISKEIYIDKENLEIKLQDYYGIVDDYELVNYISYQEKIERIIKKTINYLNYHMDKEAIKENHFKEFLELTSILPTTLPLTKTNYSLVVRPFTFEDLERIFNGFSLQEPFELDKDLENLLLDKHIIALAADGYLKDTINLGYIMSKWQSIKDMCQMINLDINKLTIFDYYQIIKENDLDNDKDLKSNNVILD